MMEQENNSSSAGRGVIEFKVHWYTADGNILRFSEDHCTMFVCMAHISTVSLSEGNDTMGTFLI